MEKERVRYSDHYEVIIALITYLAVCNRRVDRYDKTIDNATAGWLSDYLGFKGREAEVELALDGFKSLFRRSRRQYEGGYRYSLLLRYSHRTYADSNDPDISEPLPNEELFSLLDFVSSRVAMEQAENQQKENGRNQRKAMVIAASSAIIAAVTAVVSALVD